MKVNVGKRAIEALSDLVDRIDKGKPIKVTVRRRPKKKNKSKIITGKAR